MVRQTVTVGDTEVEIRETEDGFEAVEASPNPGTVEHFRREVGDDGDEISVGRIDRVDNYGDKAKVYVSDDGYDVLRSLLNTAFENNWIPSKIEFEHGYVMFRYVG